MHISRVVGIQNYGPSGTLLIQSLLDNHPEVISLPALHGQGLYKFWEKHAHLPVESLLETFIAKHRFWFELDDDSDVYGLLQLGEGWDETALVDEAAFTHALQEHWSKRETLSRKDFITTTYLAYNQALGHRYEKPPILVFPAHSSPRKYMQQLAEDFENVKMLHMVRDPVQCSGSLAKHIFSHPSLGKRILLECVVSQMLLDEMRHFEKTQVHGMKPYFKDDEYPHAESKSLRLEDIHNHPKETMAAVASWLDIRWDDCLLDSTYHGKLWHNRRESIRQSGIGQEVIKQKHTNFLSNFDKKRLRTLATAHYKAFDYPLAESDTFNHLSPLMLLLPFKMELMPARFMARVKRYAFIPKRLAKRGVPRFIIPLLIALMLPLAVLLSIYSSFAGYIRSRKLLLKALHNHQKGSAHPFVSPLIPA